MHSSDKSMHFKATHLFCFFTGGTTIALVSAGALVVSAGALVVSAGALASFLLDTLYWERREPNFTGQPYG